VHKILNLVCSWEALIVEIEIVVEELLVVLEIVLFVSKELVNLREVRGSFGFTILLIKNKR